MPMTEKEWLSGMMYYVLSNKPIDVKAGELPPGAKLLKNNGSLVVFLSTEAAALCVGDLPSDLAKSASIVKISWQGLCKYAASENVKHMIIDPPIGDEGVVRQLDIP